MNDISFFVTGTPRGQPRARAFAFKKGGKTMVRVYDPGTAEGWKSAVASAARLFLPPEPIASPVEVSCVFYLPRPKGHFRTGKNAGILRDDAPMYSCSKPDIDNYLKAIFDALVELGVLKDDAFVVRSLAVKMYASSTTVGARVKINLLTDERPLPG